MAWYDDNLYRVWSTVPAKVPASMPDGGESVWPADLVIKAGGSNFTQNGAGDTIFAALRAGGRIAFTTDADPPVTLGFGEKHLVTTEGFEYGVWPIGIPSISGAVPTNIRAYYGATVPDLADMTAVYKTTDGWAAYWALEEGQVGTGHADEYKDLTSNAYHGDDQIIAAGKTGQIGLGQQFDRVQTDWINMGNVLEFSGSTQLTIMAWLYVDAGATSAAHVVTRRTSPTWNGYYFAHTAAGLPYWGCYDGSFHSCIASTDIRGSWHMVTATYDQPTQRTYVDTTEEKQQVGPASLPASPGAILALGRPGGLSSDYYLGFLDEVSIAEACRSADWITTIFNCQFANDDFWTVDEEQGGPALAYRGYLLTGGRMR